MIDSLNALEIHVLDFIRNNLSNPIFDTVMPFISSLCNHGEVWIVLSLVLLIFKQTRRSGVVMAFALIFGLVIGNLTLKPLIHRIRPYDFADAYIIVDRLSDFSFPSGHTLASFEGAAALMYTKSKLRIPALCLAFVIAFSRLYLYVHYPTDIIASIILGTLFAYLSLKLTDYLYNRKSLQNKFEKR